MTTVVIEQRNYKYEFVRRQLEQMRQRSPLSKRAESFEPTEVTYPDYVSISMRTCEDGPARSHLRRHPPPTTSPCSHPQRRPFAGRKTFKQYPTQKAACLCFNDEQGHSSLDTHLPLRSQFLLERQGDGCAGSIQSHRLRRSKPNLRPVSWRRAEWNALSLPMPSFGCGKAHEVSGIVMWKW